MSQKKITMIGVGSHAFGLMTVRDLMERPELRGSKLALVDIAPEKLGRMTRLVDRLNQTYRAEFEVSATTDRCEALPGSDIVITAIERKHYEMWSHEIEVPRKYGCGDLYGENGGPGGMFHTMRQVGPILAIAHDIERLCPNAWLVNYSNPESRLCLAVTRYSQVKNVGVCLGAYITQNTLAQKFLGRQQKEIDIKVAGINHCHWVMDVRDACTGEDLYPEVRRREADIEPDWQPLVRDCLRRFGYFPGPGDTHVGEYLGWGAMFHKPGYTDWVFRGAQADASRDEKYDRLAAASGPLDPDEMKDLLIEGGLKWQTADIVSGLLTNNNAYVLSLNLPNNGFISNLKPGGIVEIPAIIGADRIYGMEMGPLPPAIAALMEMQLYIMDLVVDAAVTGNRKTALEALYVDPCVPNPQIAEKIFDELVQIEAEYLPAFK
jgi:alpha-galactosidase